MDHLTIDRQPEGLHNPVAVLAFSGWNDAASAATDAARFLIRRLAARQFASLDAEPFYDFARSRPQVKLGVGGERHIEWQENAFYFARNPTGPHDIVIFVGVEPDLSWRTFAATHVKLFRELGVGLSISLGALLAEVPHTRTVRVTGAAADRETAERLDLQTSRYEGPTGIVGVLHDVLRRENIPSASLWANVPHYVTTNQNPPATLALLQRLAILLGLTFDLGEMEAAGERFVAEVNGAVSGNPEIREYVRRLEAAADSGSGQQDRESDLPRVGEQFFSDIEAFLRGGEDEARGS